MLKQRQAELEAQLIAKAKEEEEEKEQRDKAETLKDLEQAKKDRTLFQKMKISSQQAMRNWSVNVIKEAIEMIPPTIDAKFDKPLPEHRWQRFSIRFKLLVYSFTEEAKTMPFQMHDFLSMLTLGKLAIPPNFLYDFEKTQLAHVLGFDRKLRLPQEIQDIKNNPVLLEAEVEMRKKHITMLIAVYVIVKVLV